MPSGREEISSSFNSPNPYTICKDSPIIQIFSGVEKRWKDNITFHANKTVSYREYRQYFFEEDMSVGNESDIVTIPNMLVLGASVMMEKLPVPVRIMISTTFKAFKEGPFLTKTVGELMWGYDSKLVNFLNQYFPGMLPVSGKFGLFAEFNNSNTGLFTVFTGQGDIRKVHQVDSWNGLKEVNYWNSDQCNMINGTAGQMWPPFMTTESTLPFYSPDACRYDLTTGHLTTGDLTTDTYRYTQLSISHPSLLYTCTCRIGETGVPMNVSIRLQLNLLIKKVFGISAIISPGLILIFVHLKL
uniref:Scavenger receptor class B member 1 n=1 Tax=Astyanax mexicanus TaxID=7994 RepID=A0A8B9H6X4_ASTMX